MKKTVLLLSAFLVTLTAFTQQFEEPKVDTTAVKKPKVNIGADFALQFQALSHEAGNPEYPLIKLGSNFNLPTANFNINTILAPGVKVNLELYLASRHHNETWVKGGYLLIDKLPFLPGSDDLMRFFTIKVGVMNPDLSDQQFRRSDNGSILRNPFVGNYIMDGFSTNTGMEIMFRNNGIMLLGGINNGTLKPALATTTGTGDAKKYVGRNLTDELAFNWKASIDKQIIEKLRVRFSLAGYHQPKTVSGTLYGGDRTGSRYYLVMNKQVGDGSEFDITKNFTSGNWGPGTFTKDNTIVANIFAKYSGLEIFGTYENAKGVTTSSQDFNFNQLAIEGIYRIGKNEQWFIGGRYNTVKNTESSPEMQVNRIQFAGGWFITKNVALKLEYVDQKYKNFANYGDPAGFKGIVAEAGISF